MMLPTHIILGLLVMTPFVAVFDLPVSVLYGAIIGSILPDLDLIVGTHRKTFHFPRYSFIVLIGSVVMISGYPSILGFFIVGLVVGFTLHSSSDVLGSGLEVRPWERTSKKAVFNHYTQEWEKPLHYFSYDGSPTDFFVLFGGSIILWMFWIQQNPAPYIQEVIILSIGVGVVYTFSRRVLPKIDQLLYKRYPQLRPILQMIRDENRTVSRDSEQQKN